MKRQHFTIILFALIFSLAFYISSNAQSVYTGNLYFDSQSDVNAIGAYTEVDGDVIITTVSTSDPISDLTPLSNIKSISGQLNINGNPNLTNLNGLGTLTSVGQIYIGNNANLTSIAALGNITSVTSNITIAQNNSLTNLTGLENITTLSGYLGINLNNALTDLHALANLKSIGSLLQIHTSPALTNLDGLESLTYVGGYLDIESNTLLKNLNGLKNLETVGGTSLTIRNNASLDSFCGLYKLFSSGTYPSFNVNISGNLVNPTKETIAAAGPCINVFTGIKYLMNQEEINSFGSNGYTGVVGELHISPDGDDITDLTPLSTITQVSEIFGIENTTLLTSLSGLEGLTSVGILLISSNTALNDLGALQNLSSIGTVLNISGNDVLENIDGLEKITSISGGISITGNQLLTSLAGLGNLESVIDILIAGNAALTNLDGLAKLTNISSSLHIFENTALTSFCGLYPLFSGTSYPTDVQISDNASNPTIAEIIAAGPCGSSVDRIPSLDIYPETCPNALNVKAKGFIPAAILGTADFDVQNINPETLLLEGVSPVRWRIKDVATPVNSEEQCDCTIEGPDGYDDLNLKFNAQELVDALGEVNDGDELELTITGNKLDGSTFEFSDCVVILAKNLGKELSDNFNSIPNEYALFENYPNPFNPSTKIQYAIPSGNSGMTTLKVYNILGKEVVTLVNETKEPGLYEVEFNAANLPSGVYFYKLSSGNFSSTKKMMLLK